MAEVRENRVSDFLNLFSSNHESDSISEAMDETKQTEVELTLGLSLNGRFGVNPIPKNTTKLTRTSSIPEHLNPSPNADNSSSVTHMFPVVGNLMRTCSLPVEPEEEVRKRKEMQSLRRMEAKKKRIEKQRKLGLRECNERKRVLPLPMKFENRVSTKGLCSEKLRNCLQGQLVVVSSQGSASESESQVIEIEGTGDSVPEARSKESNVRTLLDHMESSMPKNEAELIRTTSLGTKMKNQFHKLTVSDTNDNNSKSLARNAIMQCMPRVSTKGDDPNGKRVEGVLYRYDQSEEVMIICICHGKILSPSEFVKHAGGTDVEQPLKHIVVTPSSAIL